MSNDEGRYAHAVDETRMADPGTRQDRIGPDRSGAAGGTLAKRLLTVRK